jgi:hypothetical protein
MYPQVSYLESCPLGFLGFNVMLGSPMLVLELLLEAVGELIFPPESSSMSWIGTKRLLFTWKALCGALASSKVGGMG